MAGKNPFYADRIVLADGGVIETAAGTDIISVSSSGVATVNSTTETVVDLTTTGNTVIGNAASDTLTMNSLTTVATDQKIQFRDTGIYISSTSDGVLAVTSDTTLNLVGGGVTYAVASTGLSGTKPLSITDTETSATPGTVRTIIGAITDSTTITSGNLVGVRGACTVVSASGGFLYGAQGKVIASGTLSGSVWAAGVFGQLDISAATVNAGQCAAIWGDYGATSGTMTDTTGCRGIAMTNTTAAVLNAQVYLYGSATNLLELAGPGGTMAFVTGSAGGGADVFLTISINGVPAKIAAKYVS
jgi:hypothetical protein